MSAPKHRKSSADRLRRPDLARAAHRSTHGWLHGVERHHVFWAVAFTGFMAWALWPDEETGTVVTSASDCAAVSQVSLADCQAAYARALEDHHRLAPRFDSGWQCDQQFGTCQQDPANAAYWMPAMAGVLVGYRRRDDDGAYAGGYRPTGALPLYRERDGGFLNPNGGYVRNGAGRVTGAAGNTAPPARAITISRSGFGSSASARSSFGG